MPFPSEFVRSLPVDYFLTITDEDGIQFTPYSEIVSLIQGGISGVSGVSGLSGYSGYSGIVGISGYSGQQGVSGYSGFNGTSGFSGYSGKSGFSGYSGVSGYSGINGTSGFSGYSGFLGYSGYSGFSGYSGISGISGKSGFSGYSGLKSEFYRYNSVTSSITSLAFFVSLKSFVVPANTLSINGDFLEIECFGEFVGSSLNNSVRLLFDSTSIITLSTTLQGTFKLFAKIFRISSTSQFVEAGFEFGDSSSIGYFDLDFTNLTKNLGNNLTISIQGLSNGSTVSINNLSIRLVNAISLS